MADITKTSLTVAGEVAVVKTTLGASDTFAFNSGSVLYLDNVTAGALTPKIDGDGGTTIKCAGVPDIDVSAGYTLASIGAGDCVAIRLDGIAAYLKGTITVTGGVGIEASLLTF